MTLICVYHTQTCITTQNVEVARGQLLGVSSLLGAKDQTQVVRAASKHLYLAGLLSKTFKHQ